MDFSLFTFHIFIVSTTFALGVFVGYFLKEKLQTLVQYVFETLTNKK